jgi:hypothetical protein
MRSKARRAVAAAAIIAAGSLTGLAMAQEVGAWTYQDCVEVDFQHEDCTQYPTTTTTTTEAPTTTTTTEAPTTTTTSTAVPAEEEKTTTTTAGVVSTVPADTCTEPRGCEVVVPSDAARNSDELPFTGGMTGPAAGVGAVVLAAGALLARGWRERSRA